MALPINGNGVVPSGQPIVMQLQPPVVTPAGPAQPAQMPKSGTSEAQVCCLDQYFLNWPHVHSSVHTVVFMLNDIF